MALSVTSITPNTVVRGGTIFGMQVVGTAFQQAHHFVPATYFNILDQNGDVRYTGETTVVDSENLLVDFPDPIIMLPRLFAVQAVNPTFFPFPYITFTLPDAFRVTYVGRIANAVVNV